MLYSKYSNPKEFMHIYIRRGQFGDFVRNIFEAQRKEENERWEKDEEWKTWLAYIEVKPDMSFHEWKDGLSDKPRKRGGRDADLTDEGIMAIINNLFPA